MPATEETELIRARFEKQKCFEKMDMSSIIAFFKGKTFTVVEPTFFRKAGFDTECDEEEDTGACALIEFSSGGVGARITFSEHETFEKEPFFYVKKIIYFRGKDCVKEVMFKTDGTILARLEKTVAAQAPVAKVYAAAVRMPRFIIAKMQDNDQLDNDTRHLGIRCLKKKFTIREDEMGDIALVGIFTRHLRFVSDVALMQEFESLGLSPENCVIYHTTWEFDLHYITSHLEEQNYGGAILEIKPLRENVIVIHVR